MAGIIFLKTKNLSKVMEFYKTTLQMSTWLTQPSIEILQHENLLLGFHETSEIDDGLLITFFYDSKEEVDEMYETLGELAIAPPKVNETYKIYNFFAKDIEGRKLEFQTFLHDLPPY